MTTRYPFAFGVWFPARSEGYKVWGKHKGTLPVVLVEIRVPLNLSGSFLSLALVTSVVWGAAGIVADAIGTGKANARLVLVDCQLVTVQIKRNGWGDIIDKRTFQCLGLQPKCNVAFQESIQNRARRRRVGVL